MILSEVLTKGNFARHSEAYLRADVAAPLAEPTSVADSTRISAICGRPTAADVSLLDATSASEDGRGPAGFLRLDETRFLDSTLASDASTATTARADDPAAAAERTGQNWVAIRDVAAAAAVADTTTDDSVISEDPAPNSAAGGGRARRESVQSSSASIWDSYRAGDDNASASEDNSAARGDAPATIVVPGGIDTGKFLEEQLRHVVNHGVGPRQVLSQRVVEDQLANHGLLLPAAAGDAAGGGDGGWGTARSGGGGRTCSGRPTTFGKVDNNNNSSKAADDDDGW